MSFYFPDFFVLERYICEAIVNIYTPYVIKNMFSCPSSSFLERKILIDEGIFTPPSCLKYPGPLKSVCALNQPPPCFNFSGFPFSFIPYQN